MSGVRAALAVVLLAACGTAGEPAGAAACTTAALVSVGLRLEGVAGSGVAAVYSNGLHQVSYDSVPGLEAARAGDRVRLCRVSRPRHCPAGDERGSVYAATNLRTGAKWRAADSSHRCGGA